MDLASNVQSILTNVAIVLVLAPVAVSVLGTVSRMFRL
jgi:hypothetical protein